MAENQAALLAFLAHVVCEILVRVRAGQRGRADLEDAVMDEETRRFFMNAFPPCEFFGNEVVDGEAVGVSLMGLPTSHDAAQTMKVVNNRLSVPKLPQSVRISKKSGNQTRHTAAYWRRFRDLISAPDSGRESERSPSHSGSESPSHDSKKPVKKSKKQPKDGKDEKKGRKTDDGMGF